MFRCTFGMYIYVYIYSISYKVYEIYGGKKHGDSMMKPKKIDDFSEFRISLLLQRVVS